MLAIFAYVNNNNSMNLHNIILINDQPPHIQTVDYGYAQKIDILYLDFYYISKSSKLF